MDFHTFISTFIAGWLLLGCYGATLAIATFFEQFGINPPEGAIKFMLNTMVIVLALIGGPIYLGLVQHERLPRPKPLPH